MTHTAVAKAVTETRERGRRDPSAPASLATLAVRK